ncbi:MAG: hypothetical protein LBJ63_02605 [Prevotellaceae bacterium]|jgi:hypothetical protein|nr:hypothetical protein [Prevotellaceae bacterium]
MENLTKRGILLINERPQGMDYQRYKQLREDNNKRLKSYLRNGTLFYMAWKHANTYGKDDETISHIMRFLPYVRPE